METPKDAPEMPIEKRVFLKFPQGIVELKPGTKIEPYQFIYIRGRVLAVFAKGNGYLDPVKQEGLYDLVFAEDPLKARKLAIGAPIADHDDTPENVNPLILRDASGETLKQLGLKEKAA